MNTAARTLMGTGASNTSALAIGGIDPGASFNKTEVMEWI